MERRKQGRGSHQHFIGSWTRLNCENMPFIPAWLVRSNLNDPRGIPCLLVWKDDRHDGKIMEAVRLAHFIACGREANNYVELKRTVRAPQVFFAPQFAAGLAQKDLFLGTETTEALTGRGHDSSRSKRSCHTSRVEFEVLEDSQSEGCNRRSRAKIAHCSQTLF